MLMLALIGGLQVARAAFLSSSKRRDYAAAAEAAKPLRA